MITVVKSVILEFKKTKNLSFGLAYYVQKSMSVILTSIGCGLTANLAGFLDKEVTDHEIEQMALLVDIIFLKVSLFTNLPLVIRFVTNGKKIKC